MNGTKSKRLKNKANILKERDNIDPNLLDSYCRLKVVDITCVDCDKKFKWYAGTQRCSTCALEHRNRISYTLQEGTPMVIVNSKGLIIGEGYRTREIIKWFELNTKIEKSKFDNVKSLRYRLNENKANGILGFKLICYWIMYKEDYTFENAVKLINRRNKNLGKHQENRAYTEEDKQQILAIYNAKGLSKDIAKKFGVSRCNVAHIKTGRSHSFVTGKKYEITYNACAGDKNQLVLKVFNSNKTQSEISKEFNVSTGFISSVKTGKAYSNITGKNYKRTRKIK